MTYLFAKISRRRSRCLGFQSYLAGDSFLALFATSRIVCLRYSATVPAILLTMGTTELRARIQFVFTFALLLMGISAQVVLPAGPPTRRPNIVFIVADDLGYMDLGCYGNPYNRTPVLDSLARQGLRFTQAYAASPVCSPSRAAIMTGKHPARLQLTNFLVGERLDSTSNLLPANWNRFLPSSEVTLAERLRQQGYATGLVGKWHLGSADSLTPTAQGFDYERQIGRNGLDYYNYSITSNNKTVFTDTGKAYLTDKLTDYALEFLDQYGQNSPSNQQPFFLYLAYSAPHILLVPKADKLNRYLYRYERFNGKYNPSYGAMLESLDEGVGQVLQRLKALSLDNNTLIVFTSDNGGVGLPELGPTPTNNAPLRAWKGFVYEGGIRVPLIMRWPGVIPERSTCDRYLMNTDFVPTFAEILGLPTNANPISADGRSFYKLLQTPDAPFNRGPIFWHYPHFSNQLSRPAAAIRDGDYKLVEHYETGKTELYNLASDVAETRDLLAAEPQKAKILYARLQAWRTEVRANMPRPNPRVVPGKK